MAHLTGVGTRRRPPACGGGARAIPRRRALAALFLCAVLGAGAALAPSPALAKYASIVIEAESGRVLHAANPDERNFPASLTKMMTLYLLFEAVKSGRVGLDDEITMSRRAARQPPSKLGIKPGKSLAVRDAIPALVVKSANDVAAAVAEHLGGTERKFATKMRAKARELGMTRTDFRNASGLPNWRQRTTARDMATLVRALRRDFPDFYPYFSLRGFTFRGRTHDNHNRLLDRYEGADGVKTGYIRASGFNLAATAERAGVRLIAVVMGARSPRERDLHMMGLLERGFEAATNGAYAAYPYDRNLRIAHRTRVRDRIRVSRARGARGHVRLARLVPPRRPAEVAPVTGEGSAAAGPEDEAAAAPSHAWSVQVGAFSRFAPAHLAASRATRRLPRLLNGTRFVIRPARRDGDTVYRARLYGLTEHRANVACAILRTKNMACLPVAPDGTIVAGGGN